MPVANTEQKDSVVSGILAQEEYGSSTTDMLIDEVDDASDAKIQSAPISCQKSQQASTKVAKAQPMCVSQPDLKDDTDTGVFAFVVYPILVVLMCCLIFEPVIVFDWDDTLLASSFLSAHGYRLDKDMVSKPEVDAQLRELEKTVSTCLTTALQYGEVHVITNAETGWVQMSCEKFIPAVRPLLDRVTILSARSTFEEMFPEAPLKWKYCAFQQRLQNVFNSTERVRKNIISFGDSHVEREAVRAVTRYVCVLVLWGFVLFCLFVVIVGVGLTWWLQGSVQYEDKECEVCRASVYGAAPQATGVGHQLLPVHLLARRRPRSHAYHLIARQSVSENTI